MKQFRIFLCFAIFLSSAVWGAVPNLINFQGILTDTLGNPVADGNYTVTFRIYDAQSGGNILWQEAQVVTTSKGIFTHIMGSLIAIPDTVFKSDQRWLGIQIGSNPEITPRSRLTSTPFTYVGGKADYASNADLLDGQDATAFALTGHTHIITSTEIQNGTIVDADISASADISPSKILGTAWTSQNDTSGSGLNADLLDGLNSTDFLNVASDFGRSGVSADLYEGSTALTDKYVNATGPDSVVSAGGTALLGKVSTSSATDAYGLWGSASNSSTGGAIGGRFETSLSGTGTHYGILSTADGSSSGPIYGAYCSGQNLSMGITYGGYFESQASGIGIHYGVYGRGLGASLNPTFGSYGLADNTSTGQAYGGFFATLTSGTGPHYGVYGQGVGSSSAPTYGASGFASNTSTGFAFGGRFEAFTSGTGTHYGVYGRADGASSNFTYGSYGLAQNTSTGNAYGGYFTTSGSGTGGHYGVFGEGAGISSSPTYGSFGFAVNASTGPAYGGYFTVSSSGTGTHYGVYGVEAAGVGGAAVYAAGDFAASGTKSAVLKTSQGERLFYTIESPEIWFEDFGEGQLLDGKAHIELDALFLETVTINALNPMKAFVQLEGDCNGVYVVKGTTGFDVTELKGGNSNVQFSYRIIAKRKGYEDQRLPQTTLGMDDPNLYPELWQEIEKRHQETKLEGNLEK